MYNDNLSQKIIKKLTPTKWGMCKAFVKLGLLTVAATYYFGAIQTQMKKDESSSVFSSIEEVLKNQYEAIKDPFLSLLKKAEGKEDKFYPDNKGYAVGYGYNPTQNSVNYNKSILDYAGVDQKTQEVILKNAGKYKNQNGGQVPEEFKHVKFTPDQLDKMALYAQQSYERSFFRVLNHKLDKKALPSNRKEMILSAYANLPENKKAVLIHMAYKVGEANLEKYNNFFNNFINYLQNPTNENKVAVADSFTYKYAKNGVMLHDTRVEKIHHDLFMKEMPKKEVIVEHKTNSEKPKLTEQQKLEKAMKEVNQQITFNGALELLAKAVIKANDKFPHKNQPNNKENIQEVYQQPNNNIQDDTESEEEEPGEYYESTEDVKQVIINKSQSIEITNTSGKVSVKIR